MQVPKNRSSLSTFILVIIMVITAFGIALPEVHSAKTALSKLEDAIADVAEKAIPTVVAIKTEFTVMTEKTPFSFFGPELPKDHPFRRFFEPFADEKKTTKSKRKEDSILRKIRRGGFGSGVIISANGHVLTNSHVVRNVDKIKVLLWDKRSFKAKIVGKDKESDLAVLKIDASNLPVAKFGDSDTLRVGQFVLAIGAPYGLTRSVSMGIVSAKGRNKLEITDEGDLIQTDAAISRGSEGVPLVNTKGQVVGINVAYISPKGTNTNIGFAIPSNTVTYIMKILMAGGVVRRGLLGVLIKDLTLPLAKSHGLKSVRGALVLQVNEASPAEKAGIKGEDVILWLGKVQVKDVHHLRRLIGRRKPGDKVSVTILRNKKELAKSVILGERRSVRSDSDTKANKNNNTNIIGLEIEGVPEDIREKLELEPSVGVRVKKVAEDSVGAKMGLKIGDIILEIDGQPITGVSSFNKALVKAKKNKLIRLKVKRGKYPPNIVAEELE